MPRLAFLAAQTRWVVGGCKVFRLGPAVRPPGRLGCGYAQRGLHAQRGVDAQRGLGNRANCSGRVASGPAKKRPRGPPPSRAGRLPKPASRESSSARPRCFRPRKRAPAGAPGTTRLHRPLQRRWRGQLAEVRQKKRLARRADLMSTCAAARRAAVRPIRRAAVRP